MVRPIMTTYLIVSYIKLIVCSQNPFFEENQTAVLSCSVNVQGLNNGYIVWYRPTIQSAACNCGSLDNSVYCNCDDKKLQVNYTNIQPTKSFLTIQNLSIQDTGRWRCVLVADNQNNTDKGTYDLSVIARPQKIKCDTYFTDNNSQLQILCKTERIYPLAVCEFLKTNSQLNNSLVVYNHTTDANGYFVSTCYVKIPLLQLTPGLLNVSIKIYPNGSNSSYGLNSETNIKLEYPGPLLTDCPSPEENVIQTYIKYGSNTTCTCSTNRTGNPPATTYWINSSNNSVLQINTTKKNESYNCTVVNVFSPDVGNNSIAYTPLIGYQPSVTSFSAMVGSEIVTNVANGTVVTFKCEADGNPEPNITIGNNRKHNQAVNNGIFSTPMICQDGGFYFCNATNLMSSDRLGQRKIPIFVKCPLQLTDDVNSNEMFLVAHGNNFTTVLKIFGHPTPNFIYLEKLNVTSLSYDAIKLEQITNAVSVYSKQNRINISFNYIDLPFGELKIEIRQLQILDYSKYILYVSNNSTKSNITYAFTIKTVDQTEEDIAIAVGCGIASGILLLVLVVAGIVATKDGCSYTGKKHFLQIKPLLKSVQDLVNDDIYFLNNKENTGFVMNYKKFSDLITTITTATAAPKNLKSNSSATPNELSSNNGHVLMEYGNGNELFQSNNLNMAYSHNGQDFMYANTV